MIKKIITISTITILLSATITNSSFGEGGKLENKKPQLDLENKDRVLNDGNYRKIEEGMNPVVVKEAKKDKTGGTDFSKLGGGKLYSSTSTDTTAITYTTGSKVILNPKPYLIWYGNWNTGTKSLQPAKNDYYNFTNNLLINLQSSARWSNIIKKYYQRGVGTNTTKYYVGNLQNPTNIFVSTNANMYGNTLTQSSIYNIVKNNAGNIDQNGVYLVLTSSEIPVEGFNTGTISFCGWHSYSSTLKYGFVGDPESATWCHGQASPTPNNNVGADSMASILVHELEEAVTDPYLNAWYSSASTGNENADKCAWSWGIVSQMSNQNSYYNYNLNNSLYLIQQEFKLGTNPIKQTSSKDTFNGVCGLS